MNHSDEIGLFGPQPAKVGGKGYAMQPGSGPSGQTCARCKHILKVARARIYLKCDLVNWTRGGATDIRAGAPACARFEPTENP